MKKYILIAALAASAASPALAWWQPQWDRFEMNDNGRYDAPPYMSHEYPNMCAATPNTLEDRERNYNWSHWNHPRQDGQRYGYRDVPRDVNGRPIYDHRTMQMCHAHPENCPAHSAYNNANAPYYHDYHDSRDM